MATSLTINERGNMETDAEAGNIRQGMMLQILVVVAFVSTVVINGLAVGLPLNDMTTGGLSDKYEIYITPAGYVFSIWSVIYLGLLAFSIYQALPSQRFNPRLQAIRMPFLFSSVANMAWIFAWHYELVPLSLVIMLLIFSPLLLIHIRQHPTYAAVSAWERWTTYIPFRIYLGWISVATIVNITVILDYTGLAETLTSGVISAELWTAIILTVATAIGLFFTLVKKDVTYGLVFAWAFAGIAAKHSGVPIVFQAGMVAALIMAVSVGVAWWQNRSNLAHAPLSAQGA